jgi:hypothetical protein
MVPHFYRAVPMTQIARPALSKLTDNERKTIVLQALAGTKPISTLVARDDVSRPTVCRQMNCADVALDELFSSATRGNKVLFMLPVTARWFDQVILLLTMVRHVSFRDTVELFQDMFGTTTCPACIHTVLRQAAQRRHDHQR